MLSKTLFPAAAPCVHPWSRAGSFCLPADGNCRPDNNCLFTECGTCYNMTKYQIEPKAWLPWVAGDKIYIQTNFADRHHADPQTPTDGFALNATVAATYAYKVVLCADSGENEVIAQFVDSWLVGWSGDHSYQLLVIDTALAGFTGVDCFSLRVESVNAAGVVQDSMCTEVFQNVPAEACIDTVVIRSTQRGMDCCGNYHGDPVEFVSSTPEAFNFIFQQRFFGKVVQAGFSHSAQVSDAGVGVTRSVRTFRYNTTEYHPRYQRNLLAALFEGTTSFDGTVYTTESFSVESGFFKIPLQLPCDSSQSC